MGVLSSITRNALNVIQEDKSVPIVQDMTNTPFMTIAQMQPNIVKNASYDIVKIPAPKNIDYFEQSSLYFLDLYYRASYYFYSCSIFSTVVRKIVEEALRNGVEFVPRFQSKCPRCHTEYKTTTKKCKVCGFDGKMDMPDLTQKDLLINWRGAPLIDEVNRNGWSMLKLAGSFTVLTLVYNEPLILCKSLYPVTEDGTAVDEIPQEFVPISPTKARMLFDERGEPGQNKGFTLRERNQVYDMIDAQNPEASGYNNGQRLYPARWCVSEADGGWDAGADYYAPQEVYHDVYSVPSMTYGTPICTLVEYDIRAWIAMELRVEKYYNTGHPLGIFAVSGITPEQLSVIQQSIREQMVDDPYTMPMMGIPPGGGDTVKTAKWFQLADNPTADMMSVKSELAQRISGAFGVSGLFLGDVSAIRGNSNETQQMAIMDRNLAGIRRHINAFFAWIVSKYKGITDWELRVAEPADEQTRKQAEDLNKELVNAQLAQSIGFPIISLIDGKVEIGSTPAPMPMAGPIDDQGLHSPVKKGNPNSAAAGISLNDQESKLFGTAVGDSEDLGRNMMRSISTRQKSEDITISAEQVGRVLAELAKNGVHVV